MASESPALAQQEATPPLTQTGFVPVPDPTTLTNQLVSRAVGAVREVLEARIEDNSRRIDALKENLTESISYAIRELKELHDEKFKAIRSTSDERLKALDGVISANRAAVADRFELLDKQTIKAAADVKSAVDAAFAAAASGVSQQNLANQQASQKQEAAFTKQIDQLADNVRQISKAIGDQIGDLKKTNDDKISDLKDRIVAMEGRSSGSAQTIGFVIGALGVAIAVVTVVVSVLRIAH
jgi:hypothetical protein